MVKLRDDKNCCPPLPDVWKMYPKEKPPSTLFFFRLALTPLVKPDKELPVRVRLLLVLIPISPPLMRTA